mmetsp:Transcript_21983/g.41173  ORF Transcript_21983/g.41173 Transcript_21983/m.41173 type:complete len:283 (+) Transcript_21983:51-899(+)
MACVHQIRTEGDNNYFRASYIIATPCTKTVCCCCRRRVKLAMSIRFLPLKAFRSCSAYCLLLSSFSFLSALWFPIFRLRDELGYQLLSPLEFLLKRKIKCRIAGDLMLFLPDVLVELVIQAFVHANALVRVELQHAVHEIHGIGVHVLVHHWEFVLWLQFLAEVLNELLGVFVGDEAHVFLSWRAKHLEVLRNLVPRVRSAEGRLPSIHLGEDASDRPDINLLVVGIADHDFRGTVPPRDHIVGHLSVLVDPTRETEVTDFECGVGVEEEVGRLEVAMPYFC